ncbi:clavaminate synthase family protein [Streptomyces sp. MB09-02B]|uniref:clavaminate synthase family protein n=1 Tax=Streptomyces sp. MB09-02B TaxID=3028667 RepID=UPI0029BF19ED|nr:clavaminate synthase family protein [Streptomyces sp. MB09-02B]MDX3639642.1 clavaminate synthase family protein [Streptomyces sp. MB09-02B]
MAANAEQPAPRYDVTLEPSDAEIVEEIAWKLAAQATGRPDDIEWVEAARNSWHELPVALRRTLAAFRRDSGPDGGLLLRGLPVDALGLPPTPSVNGSVQREPALGAAVLLMIACGLGDPGAFRPEKGGALVQDVVPVPGMEEFQGNAGSTRLTFHIENAFHEHRPDFVMLLCLRADPTGRAGLRTASIRQVLPLLSEDALRTLWAPEFITAPPPSFTMGDVEEAPAPVLTGDPSDPDIRVDLAATEPVTPGAADALRELQDHFDATAATHRLGPGELAIVDNRVTVHGRTEFTPRYDGTDRWLQRTFVMTDLRRSRAMRPADGYVLEDLAQPA